MKTSVADFHLFQSEFRKWQEKFGLSGYKVYYKHELLEDSFASIHINQGDMVVTVRYNSKLPSKDQPFKDPKQSAKHEALHLLVGRLEMNAKYRYSSETEIYESVEELVHRLEQLVEE